MIGKITETILFVDQLTAHVVIFMWAMVLVLSTDGWDSKNWSRLCLSPCQHSALFQQLGAVQRHYGCHPLSLPSVEG